MREITQKKQNYTKKLFSWKQEDNLSAIELGKKLKKKYVNSDLIENSRNLSEKDIFILMPGKIYSIKNLLNFCEIKFPIALISDKKYEDKISNWLHKIKKLKPNLNIDIYYLNNLKFSVGFLSSTFYSSPSKSLNVIAITGTNGKTTIAMAGANIFANINGKAGVIGTLGVSCFEKKGNKIIEEKIANTGFTTPSAISIHKYLKFFLHKEINDIFIEASSIGIVQGRLIGCYIKTAIFTNLGHDHLDFHGNLENLARAKALLFSSFGLKKVVCLREKKEKSFPNKLIYKEINKVEKKIYVEVNPENLKFLDGVILRSFLFDEKGTQVELIEGVNKTGRFTIPTIGEHNIENAALLAGLMKINNQSINKIVKNLKLFKLPEGRLQFISRPNFPLVCIDYAHCPESMKIVLTTLLNLSNKRKGELICVFGCGGNRDRSKRPKIGSIVSKLASRGYVTSDNPRSEDVKSINYEIYQGIPNNCKNNWKQIEDRKLAIYAAVKNSKSSDVILVAGKGHESTQWIGKERLPFSDILVIKDILASDFNKNNFLKNNS